jgi:hypothetical protein
MNRWLPFVAALTVCSVGAAGYHLLKKIPVPDDYGWDYASADAEGRRLYVGHDREVVVIDLDTDAVVGTVGGGADMHGAAWHGSSAAASSARATPVPSSSLIYVSSGGDGSLSIFHEDAPDKYSLVEKVTTEAGARTLAVDHKTGRVYLPVGQFSPAAGGARGRGPMVPGSFHVLVFGE